MPSGGAQGHDFNDNSKRNLITFHFKRIFVGYPKKNCGGGNLPSQTQLKIVIA
jgi:hypothetical protein